MIMIGLDFAASLPAWVVPEGAESTPNPTLNEDLKVIYSGAPQPMNDTFASELTYKQEPSKLDILKCVRFTI